EADSFEVKLRFEGRSHGLNIDTANDEQAIVKEVSGAALAWNRNAPEMHQIKAREMKIFEA
ncbi:unnamed protein product, partial [Effrenium voratum]